MAGHQDESSNEILFKTIIVGDSGVGKSSIMNQFIKKTFNQDYNLTIGVEFASKIVNIDGQQIKLQIWDAAGQETFKSIVKSFYRKASAVFFVYNVFNQESFENISSWYEEAREIANERMVSVLIGNQTDRAKSEERKVQYEDGIRLQKELDITIFYETSAKSGENIQTVFHEAARLVYKRYQEESFLQDFVSLNLNEKVEKNGVIQDITTTKIQQIPNNSLALENKNNTNKGCC